MKNFRYITKHINGGLKHTREVLLIVDVELLLYILYM